MATKKSPAEFTLRNKVSSNPIQTLSPKVLEAFLQARPESIALALAKYCADYKRVTGKVVHLDYAQTQIFLKHAGADSRGYWASKYSNQGVTTLLLQTCFRDGFLARTTSEGLLSDLQLAEAFFDMLDGRLA